MLIKDMFEKDIDREIRGVIKADQTDEADVKQELEEYVVTRELHKHFSKFYENYLKGIDGETDKVGVWISGFFGSGKSHFLKILAHLLNNEAVDGKLPVDYFEDKIEDPIVYANMKRTANIPTETILFNIDSKSQLDNKSKEDAILRVLLKVFNEHRGYYGDNLGIAKLEQYLDEQGLFDKFKEEFKKAASEAWEDRRHTFYFDSHYVKTALLNATSMTEEAITTWLEHGVDHVEISIENFAKDVKKYIDSKEQPFHLIFLIDEVGQYIGDSRDLMLNLQTVTENLGAFCHGKAWVMVTSQESIDSIVKVKGDDFSRIQGRFDTKLSLSSVSVDEVIQKRVLEKKEYVDDSLQATYPNKGAILNNLISFRDSTADLRGYSDAKEFSNVYPFVPYQFRLLQNVFEQVRKHGSSGKHLSEGERSMLSAYREAGIRFMEEEKGTLIPFYAFYDTIKEFLQPTVSRVIERAASNKRLADDPFNVELLKVLFMIKYVKELSGNIDNIATLMVTHIDEDKLQLKEKIQAALRKLIQETLIQKNGEEYIFLTDDEQDVNNEIKQVSIDEDAVRSGVANYIFNDLYDDKKYSYSNVYDFSFNRIMDEKTHGNQSSTIGMEVLSPLSSKYDVSDQQLQMESSGTNHIIVKLGSDGAYVDEIEAALKIEAYRRGRNIHELPENIQNILNNKQVEMRQRRSRARDMMVEALKDSTFYINGSRMDVKGATVKEKMNNAFELLVDNVYTKLSLMEEHTKSESELKSYLQASDEQTTLDGDLLASANEQAKQEVDAFIRLQKEMGHQIQVKTLFDQFSNVPFGWRQLDIARLIAEALKNQQIRIRYNAVYLEPTENVNELMTVFTKPVEAARAIVTLREVIDENLIRTVRRAVRDLFDKRDLADDEDGLVRDIRVLIDQKLDMIQYYKNRYENRAYPGMSLLDKGLEHFEQFDRSIDNLTFFTRLKDAEDDIGYWIEDIEYVVNFFGSNQQSLYDSGLAAMEQYEEIKHYVATDEVEAAMKQLADILNDPIPYGKIKDIPTFIHTLEEQVEAVLNEKVNITKEKVQLDFDEVSLQLNAYGLSQKTKEQIERQFNHFLHRIDEEQEIHKVDAIVTQSSNYKDRAMQIIKEEIKTWQAAKAKEQEEQNDAQVSDPIVAVKPKVQKEVVDITELITVQRLTTEDEVDKYVSTLAHKLKLIIKSNKEIEFKN